MVGQAKAVDRNVFFAITQGLELEIPLGYYKRHPWLLLS